MRFWDFGGVKEELNSSVTYLSSWAPVASSCHSPTWSRYLFMVDSKDIQRTSSGMNASAGCGNSFPDASSHSLNPSMKHLASPCLTRVPPSQASSTHLATLTSWHTLCMWTWASGLDMSKVAS